MITKLFHRPALSIFLPLAIFYGAPEPARAASGTWTNLGGGSWAASLNWNGGGVASGSGNTADFSTLTLGAAPTVTLDGAQTIGNLLFGDVGGVYGWTLTTGSGGALTLAGTAPTITVNNQTAAVNLVLAGANGLTKAGPGVLALGGANIYSGGTTVSAGVLRFLNTINTYADQTITIDANAFAQSTALLNLNVDQNASIGSINVTGAGTLQMTSTNGGPSSPDIYFGPDHSGNAYWGVAIGTTLDLGRQQRFIYGKSGHNGVGQYGLTKADCQFAGSIIGSGGLTIIAQMTYNYSTPAMEVAFCLNAANTSTGALEVQRGSVYLGHANALSQTNVLFLNSSGTNNARFFLYGQNAIVANLSSSMGGMNVIANGNEKTGASLTLPAATLIDWQDTAGTFWGSIQDVQPEYDGSGSGTTGSLNLVKNGPASLTLTGSNTYGGTTVINAGTLFINGSSTGGGAVTVNAGGVLAGNGTLACPVIVNNGGLIQTGDATANGALTMNSLALGSASGDASILNLAGSAPLLVIGNNGLLINSGANSVTVNVGGSVGTLEPVPLITYSGALGGSGFGALQLGSMPPGASGYLSNDVAHTTIDFVATQITIPRWTGALSADWNVNILASPKNWVQDSDGVTPVDYMDGENVIFDDTAADTTVIVDVANVLPQSVLFNNSARSYDISGPYGIAGTASLTKQGSGKVTVGATNSYTGPTTIAAGTLALASPGALPGGPGYGRLTVNGTLDVGGFSPTVNNLSGSGTVDNATAGGSPILTENSAVNSTFAGIIQNTSGSLGLTVTGAGTLTLNGGSTYTGPTVIRSGALSINGSLAAGGVTAQKGAALGGTGHISGPVALADGSTLNLTANAPLTVGSLALNGSVTVNVAGDISSTDATTYVLLNHAARGGTGSYLLNAVPGLINSGFTAILNDTSNQLQLVVGPVVVTGTIADVRHVVIFTQENRSFDHYFGSLHGVHGFSDHVTLTWQNGNSVFYQPNGSSYELPFHTSEQCLNDLGHDWSSTHQAWDSGWEDGWIAAKGTESMVYYNRGDIPYQYALADAYTICDDYHCSAMTSTDPNRLYITSGMIDPGDTGGGPVIDNTEPSAGWGTNWITYPQRLQKAGVSWKVYQATDNFDDNALAWFAAYKQAEPGDPLYDNGMEFVSDLVSNFQADVSNNTLPSVSWIIGPDTGSEHPYWSPSAGAVLTKQLLDALASNPAVYNSTVFMLNYDENDGFFDHMVPITPPVGTTNEFVGGSPIGLGVRVPMIIISPWTRGGYVCSQTFDHTSLIRFLEKWTGVPEPNISAWRRQVCGDLTSAFDFAHPNTNYPSLTNVTAVICDGGTAESPPVQQSMPSQEAGTLLERPLPYQPNAAAALGCAAGSLNITMTNFGSASVHFSIYPNAYRSDGPWPYDVNPGNSASALFSTTTNGGNYDFSCYGPNGFLRRFAGNLNADCGQVEAVSYLNPYTGGFEITLGNPSGSAVVFSVTNGYFANSLATYQVPAYSTNLVSLDLTTNNGWYDLTATTGRDSLFLRRFSGHIESNAAPAGLTSSENPSGYRESVTFIATVVGYSIPTGTVQFKTNGILLPSAAILSNGVATATTALLPRGTNTVTAEYSGDALNPPVTNSCLQVVLDHPPVPSTAFYARPNNASLSIAISDLLTNVTDVDGDPITFIGVGTDGLNLRTTNGASLATNSTYILYTNSVAVNVNDSFEYTVSDGHGGTSLGTVLIVMESNLIGQTNVNLILSSTNATLNFFGVPGFQYAVERSTNLAPGVGLGWVSINTNVAPSNGIIPVKDDFHDLGIQIPPLPATAFYRLRYDP
jgi:phospholipase C